jgi:ribulose-5-phosphate 4-epimerase/fuculose-1-phosphate aldolase
MKNWLDEVIFGKKLGAVRREAQAEACDEANLSNITSIRINLAYAYRILANLGLDDHTYTHISARACDSDAYYIYPFGMCFAEVKPDNLMKVSLDGEVIEGQEYQYNKTGYIIHGAIYQARPDIKAIFHVHEPSIVAVSSIKDGLMPSSQWALHFYNKIAYHDYDSLALEGSQGDRLIHDLADKFVMLLRNHGSITCGRTIQEAMFYTYHLAQACKTQCLTLSMNKEIVIPNEAICKKAVHDLLSFESNLGERDWQAWIRKLGIEFVVY